MAYGLPKIYLAARHTRRVELCRYAALLSELGYDITSRWLYTDDEANVRLDDIPGLAKFAEMDREDVVNADIMVNFTEEPASGSCGGGRHVEFGMALAIGKECFIIGYRENIFHNLPEVKGFNTWDEMYNHLEDRAVA